MKSIKKPLINVTIFGITLATLVLSLSSTAMAKIYKWTDASGKTHYTATPPPTKIKAKTEEFKVRKVKKSSLTFKGDESYSVSNRKNKSNTSKRVKQSPQSQCRNALRKVPAMTSSLKRKLRQAKARGKVSDIDFKKAMDDLNKTKAKPQTMKECLQNYKRGGTKQSDVDLVANNSAEDALSYMMLNAAFEQAAKEQFKERKK